MKSKWLFLMMISGPICFAGGNCDTTSSMSSIMGKIDSKTATEQDISSGRVLLQYFKFCSDPVVLQKQIPTVVDFSLRMIRADVTGDSDSYFYDIYKERKADISSAMSKLTAAQQSELKKSLDNTAVIWKKGNGAPLKSKAQPSPKSGCLPLHHDTVADIRKAIGGLKPAAPLDLNQFRRNPSSVGP